MQTPTSEKRVGAESAAPGGVAARVRLMRDGLLNYAGFMVSGAVGIVMVPVMLHALGDELYGVWIAMLSAIALGAAADLGLGWTVTREVAAAPARASAETRQLVLAVRDGFVLLGLAGAAVFALLGVTGAETGRFSGATAHAMVAAFLLGGVIFFAAQMGEFSRALLRGLGRFDLVSLLSAGFAVAWALGVIGVVACGGKLLAVAAVYAAIAIAIAAGAAALACRSFPEIARVYRRGELAALSSRFSFGLASQTVAALTSLLWEVAPLVIGWMLGAAAIVPYHVGRKFPLAAAMLGWSAAGVLFPAASEHGRERASARSRETLEVGTRWIVAMVAPLCVAFWILAPNLLRVWLGGGVSRETIAVMRVMSTVVVADAFGEAALYFLWGAGEVSSVLAVAACEVVAHLALLIWMLGFAGPVGAAWALLIPKIGGSFVLVALASRWCAIGNWRLVRNTLNGLLAPLGAMLMVLWAAVSIANPAGWPGVIAVVCTAGAVYGGVFYRMGARTEERVLIRQAFGLLAAALSALGRSLPGGRRRSAARIDS